MVFVLPFGWYFTKTSFIGNCFFLPVKSLTDGLYKILSPTFNSDNFFHPEGVRNLWLFVVSIIFPDDVVTL